MQIEIMFLKERATKNTQRYKASDPRLIDVIYLDSKELRAQCGEIPDQILIYVHLPEKS